VYATSPAAARGPVADGGSPVDARELAGTLAQLRRELERLRESLDASRALPQPSLERHAIAPPAGGGAARDERLALALERLVERLSAAEPDLGREGLPASPPAASDPRPRSERLALARRQDAAERLAAHFLRSDRELVELYGIPDVVYTATSGEVHFVYQRDESEPQLAFSLANGKVVRVGEE
jgi:hypothetical protein